MPTAIIKMSIIPNSGDIVTWTSNVDNFGMYKSTVFNIFARHVPKKKYIHPNEAPFMLK